MASITTANRNRAADAVCARANGGSLRIYGGTPPADANAALSGNTLLATLALSATAYAAAVSGVATANAITAAAAAATGKPTFARVLESDGTTVVFQQRCALAWLASTVYAVGDYVTNGGNTYRCTTGGTSAASGGPSGTGTGISDGSAVWAYDGVNEVALGGGVSVITAGGNVSISSATYTQQAS